MRRYQGSSTRSLCLQQEEYIELWLVVMINLVSSEMQDFAQQEATRGRMNKRGKMRKQKSENRVQVPKETQKRPKERGGRGRMRGTALGKQWKETKGFKSKGNGRLDEGRQVALWVDEASKMSLGGWAWTGSTWM